MPTLMLTERQQAALRSLMTLDAARERTLPPQTSSAHRAG